MGSRDGALKVAARRVGVTVEEYTAKVAAGQKWCTRCRAWRLRSEFVADRSRGDGLAASCRAHKDRRQFKLPLGHRRGWVAPTRDGDVRQARRRVNYLVEQGRIPRPNDLPCTDCGHIWSLGERRHEYDHHVGYDAEHQLDVEPVCTTCHQRREETRCRT